MKADKVKTLKDMTRAELIRECEEKAQLLKQSFEAYAKVSASLAGFQEKSNLLDKTVQTLVAANARVTHLLQAEVIHRSLPPGLGIQYHATGVNFTKLTLPTVMEAPHGTASKQ